MAFDQATRNRLASFVSDARSLLTEEFTRQFQQEYGMDPSSGDVADIKKLFYLDDASRETAGLLRSTLEHYLAGIANPTAKARQEALVRIVREQAFTVLNRLCALRMAEARELLIESVAAGYRSRGFQLYARLAGTALGESGDAYRSYLHSVFDELAVDLPVLFDRWSPQGRLFPRESALLELLDQINRPAINSLWAEDETIGWIYQYFNSKEERKAMREASQAPRNSRELAVRNQFFTPRYVVEFLADNTLGRLWYEMTHGETSLVGTCRYLVRRPNEVFLAEGEQAPAQEAATQDLSQEELLQNPVYVPHRMLKDPRDIKMLDPACGSMHFGLYAFDLFERIYEEAWDMQANGQWPESTSLLADYASKDAFLHAVPCLIVERNIHGIDIDPRAVQISGLSLWLRAQKSWRDQRLKPQERPAIRRSNIVCAEPMPGEKGLLKEFITNDLVETSEDRAIGGMLPAIFTAMELAGEAGSLLKIEEQIAGVVEEARNKYERARLQRRKEAGYLPGFAPERDTTMFDLHDLPNAEEFWQQAEDRIYAALRDYAVQAENGDAYRRRLFADDAARGFAFIDLCRKRYDAVLMNPPFGSFSRASKSYVIGSYPISANDIFAAFIEGSLTRLLHRGLLGAITSRTAFFTASFSDWRKEIVGSQTRLLCFADLGGGVMDAATVEAAAYSLQRDDTDGHSGSLTPFLRVLVQQDKEDFLALLISKLKEGYTQTRGVYWATFNQFALLPDAPFAYWVHSGTLLKLAQWPHFEPSGAQVRKGLRTGDNFRFVRTFWEIPQGDFTPEISSADTPTQRKRSCWVPLVLSGSSQPWFSPLLVVLNWRKDGQELRQYVTKYGSPSRLIQAEDFYFKAGMSWTLRSTRFVPYAIPAGCIPTGSRPMAFPDKGKAFSALAISASRVASAFMRFYGDWFARPKFLEGKLKLVPWPDLSSGLVHELSGLVQQESAQRRNSYQGHEPFFEFVKPFGFGHEDDKQAIAIDWSSLLGRELERAVEEAYGLTQSEAITMCADLEEALAVRGVIQRAENQDEDEDEGAELILDISRRNGFDALVSHAVGCTFGRWDIRYATGEKQTSELTDPFAPLPVCPPGVLQNALGRPAGPTDVPTKYPLRISWSGILVDDESHSEGLERRVREALQVIWKDHADTIELEASQVLGVRSLSSYFRKPAGFFADHLARYSKSRRQAPIYWPLSTRSGSYTLWLYYHSLTDQKLYTCVNDFVDPKLQQVADDTSRLRQKPGRTSGDEKELERLSDLLLELQDFRAELLRLAAIWKPNLNDGVQITAAPLWRLFQFKPWRARLKETWEKLEAGDFDWAHLAYSVWPDRVRQKCRTDKSLAIAHDLEDLYEEPKTQPRTKRGKPKQALVEAVEGLFDDD